MLSVSRLAGMVRPLCLGASIGHPRGSLGTLGAFVAPAAGETTRGILSTMTVLAPPSARADDYIHQPGPGDNSLFTGESRVARLSTRIRYTSGRQHRLDAAFAELLPGIEVTGNVVPPDFPDAGKRIELVAAADATLLNAAVAKIGRGTGFTQGHVTSVSIQNLKVYVGKGKGSSKDETFEFDEVIEITGSDQAFSGPGDSGALVYSVPDYAAVGLVFASTSISDGKNVTYAIPVAKIFDAFSLRLA
jgi:hypothetical protein